MYLHIYIYVYVYTVLNNTILSYTILISQFLFHSTLFHSVLLRYIMFITGSLHCGMLHDTAWSGLIFCYIKAFYIHMHTHKYICICIIYMYTCSLATDWPTDRPTYSHTHDPCPSLYLSSSLGRQGQLKSPTTRAALKFQGRGDVKTSTNTVE